MRSRMILSCLVVLIGLVPLETPSPAHASAQPRSLEAFIVLIAGDLDSAWALTFRSMGRPYARLYRRPGVVRFYAPIKTACGAIVPGDGPSYCYLNQVIYLDMAMLADVWQDDTRDFAAAVVIAHEWAHHVQSLLGVTLQAMQGRFYPWDVELQADCLAGTWASLAAREGRLEPGDIDEAVAISWHAGDPPWARGHGTGQERVNAFLQGYQFGDIRACALD